MAVVLEKAPVLEKKPVRTQIGIGTSPTAIHPGGLYSRFLELPGPVVLLVLWLAGAVVISSCALAVLYSLWLLVQALAGL